MNPLDLLLKSSNAAREAHLKFQALYDALCDLKRSLPSCTPLRWDEGELQLTEDGKAIVRWRSMNHTVILVAVVPNDPGRRVWGYGYYTRAPYYTERTQSAPPAEWLAFVRQIYP